MQCFLLNIAPWTKIDHRTGVAMDASFDSPKKNNILLNYLDFKAKEMGYK
jgi:hypothetical protein